ncbi:CBM_HP2_G0000780.mRNA.1.CDS.1 [Saccharomyces cerevisiae]|nr:CBM_HP2_G0000780.mRNA.1.CDS.1 [Saccharomyces cerevisiae]CAI6447937.1 CBM_HP2_G0000780.mRNA.1.CDS.1 [Saccharomyces cerevisiae]
MIFVVVIRQGPAEKSERLLSQGLLSATSPRKTIAVRVAIEITQPCASGTERSSSRSTEKQCTNSLEGSHKDFLSLPLGHSYLFLFCLGRMICSEPKL